MAGNVTATMNLTLQTVSNLDGSSIFNRQVPAVVNSLANAGIIVYAAAAQPAYTGFGQGSYYGLYIRNLDLVNSMEVLMNGNNEVGTFNVGPGGVLLLYGVTLQDFGQLQARYVGGPLNFEYAQWS